MNLRRSRSYVHAPMFTLLRSPLQLDPGTGTRLDRDGLHKCPEQRNKVRTLTTSCSGVPQRPEGWNVLIPPPPVSHTHPIRNVRHAHTCKHTKTHTETAEEEKRRREKKRRRGENDRIFQTS